MEVLVLLLLVGFSLTNAGESNEEEFSTMSKRCWLLQLLCQGSLPNQKLV